MNEILETYTMTTEEEIKWLRGCVRDLQNRNTEIEKENRDMERTLELVSNSLYTSELKQLKQQNEFLTKRENKLQTIEQMYKSGSVDLDYLRKIVLEEE